MPKPSLSIGWQRSAGWAAAALSGLLLGLAYPPADFSWIIWVALVPLLWAVRRCPRPASAAWLGLVTAVIFYLIVTHPLTSAHAWAGWQSAATPEDHDALVSQQQLRLYILWVLWPFWAGLWWAVSTWLLARLSKRSLWETALLAPPLFIFFTEWLRSNLSYDHHWAFLGNAAIDTPGVLQLGSLGGVWLLSWLVVLVNVGLLGLIRRPKGREWALPGAMATLFLTASAWGVWYSQMLEERWSDHESHRTAAIQYHQSQYSPRHYTVLGIERDYLELMQQVARGDIGKVQLLVLPESIAFATLSLDGSRAEGVPEQLHQRRQDWEEALRQIIDLSEDSLAIILGVDTAQQSLRYNSLTFWTQSGLAHHYHKQNLVPFAEYQPEILRKLGISGQAQFSAGQESAIGDLHGIRIGSFICQEVLTPAVLRRSVLNGAELLVSGGNDGVFANPAIADVHAKLARLRAAESQRFIVRAMKTGISAIISPTGKEISRSPSSDPYIVVGEVSAKKHLTLFSRVGNWPVGLAFLIIFATGLANSRSLRRSVSSGA